MTTTYAELRERHGLPAELSSSTVARIARIFRQEPEEAAHTTRTTTDSSGTASRVGGPNADHPTASAGQSS